MKKSGEVQKSLRKTKNVNDVQNKAKARKVREELGDNRQKREDSREIDKQE